MAAILLVAFVVVPLTATPYVFTGILIPFLILSLAALGLNILTGYAGQLSLGTAAFMAVGAFASYNFMLRVPGMPILVAFAGGGIVAALVGMLFGLPSLRIRGFYLAVATLAAQFFILWFLTKVGWVTNYSSSGVITARQIVILGYAFTTPAAKYLLVLSIVVADGAGGEEHGARQRRPLLDGGARHGRRGGSHRHPAHAREAARLRGQLVLLRRRGRAVRLRVPRDGRAGGVQPRPFVPHPVHGDHRRRGHRAGRRFSAARSSRCCRSCCRVTVRFLDSSLGLHIAESTISNLELMVFGGLIIFFLIVEPHGLARLWQIAKEKLRLWPFPH